VSHRIGILALVVGAVAACANPNPQSIGPEGWIEIHSKNFVVIGNAAHEELRKLASDLEIFDALVTKVAKVRTGDAARPVRLYVFGSEKDASRFTGWADGIMMPSLSGYFAIVSAENPGFRFATRHVLLHEYVHAVVRRNRRIAYPRWYDEGFCEFLGSAHFRDDGVISGAAPTGRLESLSRSGFMPLVRLFSEDTTSRKEVHRFYASSWALVHYLNTAAEKSAQLAHFVSRLSRGESWRGAFAAAFEQPLDSLQAEVEAHVARLQKGARFDFSLRMDSLTIPTERSEEVLTAAEISYQLGGLARTMGEETERRNDLKLAENLFRQALRRDPDDARARAALGWIHAKHENWIAAESLVRAAMQASPDDPVVVLDAARVYALRTAASPAAGDTAQRARATLLRAVELAPNSARAHEAMARFYAATDDDPQRAIAEFERARKLGEWSPSLDVDLATQLLRVGDSEDAEPLLVAVAADVHGGDTADQARRMLESLLETGPGE